jgi:hypothetical protein
VAQEVEKLLLLLWQLYFGRCSTLAVGIWFAGIEQKTQKALFCVKHYFLA